MKRILCSLLLLVCTGWAQAQHYAELLQGLDSSTPFRQIQAIVNRYFDEMPVKDKEYKQWKRYEWMASRRLGRGGIVEDATWHKKAAMEERNQLLRQPQPDGVMATHGSWSPIGPTGTSNNDINVGRVVCMAFHPTDANTFYVGSASGGLWKTINGGSSYTALTDNLPAIAISSIVIHPTNPNTVYILTGDGNGSGRGHYIRHYGTGVYRSTDGGDTWSETGMLWDLSSITFGYKMLMHPSNSNVLLAGTSTGFWRSLNGGVTWERTFSSAQITDIEFKPGSASHVFASGYGNTFYYSTDTGRTWNSRNLPVTGVNRMEIGVSPASPNLIYFLCGPHVGDQGNYKGLYTINTASSYGSATITTRSTSPNILGYANDGVDDISQTWRNISIYVSPTDAQDIFTGGCFIWKSTNSGVTMTKSSGTIHADNHFILKHPLNNDLYSGCDGGLFKSTDGGTTWNSISRGMQITQFYRFDAAAQNSFRFICGAQDNSQMVRNGSNVYNIISCCDGMDNAMDYTNPDVMYMCTQEGAFSKSINGTTNNAAVTQPTAGADYWVTNLNIHTTANGTVFFGGTGGIRRSTDGGASWSNIGGSGKDGMAQGTSNDDRMYAAEGLIMRRSDNINAAAASVTWTNISGSGASYPSDPDIFITAIAVNPDNSNEVWITLCGFVSGQKVYRSTDAGATWTNMSAGLPNLPVHSIVFEDNDGNPGGAVYVGTELGVFYRNNNLGSWIPFSNYLPNAPVTDLKIYYGTSRYLYASTYGRGMWYTSPYSTCLTDLSLSATQEGHKYWEASNSIQTNASMAGNAGTEIFMKAGNFIQFNTGATFSASQGELKAWIGSCGSGGVPSMRNATLALGLQDPATFFNQVATPLETPVSSPELRYQNGSYIARFSSDGKGQCLADLRGADHETIGWWVKSVLPAGSYQVSIPALPGGKPFEVVIQGNGQRVKYRVQGASVVVE